MVTKSKEYQSPEAGLIDFEFESVLCGSFGVHGAAGTLEDGDSYELN